MGRELSEDQRQSIDAFKKRFKENRGNKWVPGHAGRHFCNTCEAENEVNEDARPSQIPIHCEACQGLIKNGLMALATGRLYETMQHGYRYFEEGDGAGFITTADIKTVSALISDDPSLVAVHHIREGNMTRLIVCLEK